MKITSVLIVAAGRGHRFGAEFPKQYLKLGGVPVLRRTAKAFLSHPEISSVRVVIHPDDIDLYEDAVAGLDLLSPVWGGKERQDSVRLGLQALAEEAPDAVLIHDGARPFVSPDLISRVLKGLDQGMGVVPTLPLTDTIKRAIDGQIISTEDRTRLWRAQTPQGFDFPTILDAHEKQAGRSLTDDSAICEETGIEVLSVEGDSQNIKITTPRDLEDDRQGQLKESCKMEIRTGQGYDVHRFEAGSSVTLCGLEIPHTASLAGHSDADAGLHALTDALLGAIGEGDIGHFFPPSDEKWRGVASDVFVRHAVNLITNRGGRVVNVDITLICEAPKIGPHRIDMKNRVADILGVPPGRVNVKATTTEKLGFTGRREGIAANAIATVEIPETGE